MDAYICDNCGKVGQAHDANWIELGRPSSVRITLGMSLGQPKVVCSPDCGIAVLTEVANTLVAR
jgi:hypothetical protein